MTLVYLFLDFTEDCKFHKFCVLYSYNGLDSQLFVMERLFVVSLLNHKQWCFRSTLFGSQLTRGVSCLVEKQMVVR